MPKATAKPKPQQKPRLVLVLAGVPYSARRAEAPVGYRWAWELTREDAKAGEVSHVVAASAAGSMTCDCEAQRFRPPCKHVRAARLVGLL